MNMHRLLFASIVLISGNAAGGAAQTYPARPIAMVLPFAAGGQADVIARALADSMRASLGQPVVIENVSGAGGNIGVGRVARAAPDGHTLILGSASQFVNSGAVYSLPYDLIEDFAPVALIVSSPHMILATKAVPAKNLGELIAWIKVNHNRVSQGHSGIGTGPHLCGIDMQNRLATRWTFVPYRGAAPAMQDLLGGQIDLICTTLGSAVAMVRGGQVNAYAIAGRSRLPAVSGIPTVDEAGLPGLHVLAWYGLWAPKGTPKPVIAKLNQAVAASLEDKTIGTRLADLGLDVRPREMQTPEALGAFQKAEIEKWWPIIKAAGIKSE
jgi:tripartite-type tricarboxylate transporter receptor subunit TctC